MPGCRAFSLFFPLRFPAQTGGVLAAPFSGCIAGLSTTHAPSHLVPQMIVHFLIMCQVRCLKCLSLCWTMLELVLDFKQSCI